MNEFKEFDMQRKRVGQSWQPWGCIYAKSFIEAKKEFADRMTKSFWESSDGFVWKDKEEDKVEETGWYIDNELYLSKECIEAGFDYYTEDVWSYRVLDRTAERLDSFFKELKESYSHAEIVAGITNGDIPIPDWMSISENTDHLKVWDEDWGSAEMGFKYLSYAEEDDDEED